MLFIVNPRLVDMPFVNKRRLPQAVFDGRDAEGKRKKLKK